MARIANMHRKWMKEPKYKRPDIVELANVGMVQRSNHPRFPFEPFTEACGRDLDRHLAVQARVGRVVDFAHAAGSQEALDAIGTQALAGLQRGGSVDQLCRRSRRPRFGIGRILVIREQRSNFTP